MNEFLNVGRSLEIKGINNDIETPDNEQLNYFDEKEFEQTNELPVSDYKPEKIVKDDMSKPKKLTSNRRKNKQCEQCNYTASYSHVLQQHIKSIHEGVIYSCDQCDHKATTLSNLGRHIRAAHDGVEYSCEKCNFKSSRSGRVQEHIKAVHGGVKYSCDQCSYKATRNSLLKRHKDLNQCVTSRPMRKFTYDEIKKFLVEKKVPMMENTSNKTF